MLVASGAVHRAPVAALNARVGICFGAVAGKKKAPHLCGAETKWGLPEASCLGPPLPPIGPWSNDGIFPAPLCAIAKTPIRFVDKSPILQYFDAGNPGERQQIICTG